MTISTIPTPLYNLWTFCPEVNAPPDGAAFLMSGHDPGESEESMQFFTSAVNTLQTLVIALGAGLAVWGVVNLLEGYGLDNPGANACV